MEAMMLEELKREIELFASITRGAVGYVGRANYAEREQEAYQQINDALATLLATLSRLIEQAEAMPEGWRPIETAPIGKDIEILPEIGLYFVGDIWDCSMRTDIKEDKLARLRCWDGHIATREVGNGMKWRPLRLPQPPAKQGA
jgi:hypothetical protein